MACWQNCRRYMLITANPRVNKMFQSPRMWHRIIPGMHSVCYYGDSRHQWDRLQENTQMIQAERKNVERNNEFFSTSAFKNTLVNPSKWNARYLYGNVCWVLAADSRLMSANIPDLEVIPKCRFSSAHIVGYSQVDFFSRTVTTCRNNFRSIARRIWVSDSNILCSKLWGTDSPLLA